MAAFSNCSAGSYRLFKNIRMVTVLLIPVFWLLYKQAIQVSTRTYKLGVPVSVFVPPGKISLIGPGWNSCGAGDEAKNARLNALSTCLQQLRLKKEFTATAVEKRVYSNCGWKKSLQQLPLKKEFTATAVGKRVYSNCGWKRVYSNCGWKKSLQQLRLKKELHLQDRMSGLVMRVMVQNRYFLFAICNIYFHTPLLLAGESRGQQLWKVSKHLMVFKKLWWVCWLHTKTGRSYVEDVITRPSPWSTSGLLSRMRSQVHPSRQIVVRHFGHVD